MYESFFDLSSRPFTAAPVVQHYFPTPITEQARQTLIRIVDRAEGPGLIIGQPGLGKTLLLRMLQHHFQNVFHCVHLASAAIESRKDLLQNVLFELDLPYRDMEEGELRLSLLDFLRPSESCPHGVLLLVDEAHTLPLQLLDEIRMITNLVRDGQPRVRLVLAGDAQLDDVFADPRLDSFNQRIAARCYLEPLNQEQTIEYVQAQIAATGGTPSEIFTHDALVAVYRALGGIPRLINQVSDHSMVMASLGGYHQLDAAGIEEAWADLQQLPGPWNDPAPQSSDGAESIVEFGSLDEDDAAPASSVAESHDTLTDFVDQQSVEATDSVRLTDATGGGVDSTHAEAIDPAAEAVTSITAADAEVAAPLADVEPETCPDPANEAPVAGELSAAASVHEFAPLDNSNPELLPDDAGTDYDKTNVVQVGWEVNAIDAIALSVADSVVDASEEPAATVEEQPVTVAATEPDAVPTVATPTETVAIDTEFVDPFGQGFDEEEVVVDRYADLDGGVFAGCPRVSSEEGRALAAIMNQQSSPQLSVVDVDVVGNGEASDIKEEQVAAPVADLRQPESAEEIDVAIDESEEASDEPALAGEFNDAALANNVFDTSSLSDWLFESATETVVAGGTETEHVRQVENEPPSSEVATSPAESSQAEPVVVERQNDASPVTIPLADDQVEPSFLQVHDGPSFNDDRDLIVIDEDKHEGVFLTQSGDDLARRVEYQQLFSQLREG